MRIILLICLVVFSLNAGPSEDLYDYATNGDLDKVKGIIKKANINYQNELGNTPLMNASYKGHLEVVKYLISQKANVNAKAKDGWTALIAASGAGHLEVVKFLVENKADIKAKTKDGITALKEAENKKNTEIVEYLKNIK